MVDYFKHVHKTGMDRVLAEQEIRHDEWTERDQSPGTGSGRSSAVPKSAEEHVADIVFIVIWGGMSYYGITQLDTAWYWPVGVGFVTGVIMQKLLLGPLFFLAGCPCGGGRSISTIRDLQFIRPVVK